MRLQTELVAATQRKYTESMSIAREIEDIARDLKARGHRVVAVDASPTLIGMARQADPPSPTCDVTPPLPFDDGSFEIVVFDYSLMDFDEWKPAFARVPAS